jgi:hypothetical protein
MTAHAAFNDTIRRAAGRGTVPRLERDAPVKVGNIGVGKGGSSGPPRPPSESERINAELRGAMLATRGRIHDPGLWR